MLMFIVLDVSNQNGAQKKPKLSPYSRKKDTCRVKKESGETPPHPFDDEVCALWGQRWGRHVRLGHHQVAWFQITDQYVGLGETQARVDWTVIHLNRDKV